MAVQVLTDVRGYFGGLDATNQNTQVSLDGMVVDLDATTMGSGGWTATAGGLKSGKLSYSSWGADGETPGLTSINYEFWTDLVGGFSVPFTLIPTSGAAGSGCYIGKLLDTEVKRFDKVGALDPTELSGVTDGPMVAATVLHPQGTARTVTGVGTGFQYAAITTGHSMVIVLHALSITGTTPTIAVTVQSATSNAFTAPTTRATFTGVTTTVGGQLLVVPGPITDTWWRVSYAIGGTSPSYLFACSAGIL